MTWRPLSNPGLENSCDFRSGTPAVIAQRDQTNLYNYIRSSIYRLLGEFQKFWVSLVYFYALFSLFPPHPHIVRHCVESRDFVRTHMSSDSKTMYHVVSGISLQSHRYVFGNVTAVLSLYIYVCAFLLYIPQCSGVLCLLHVSHFLPLRHLVTDREGVASPFPKLFSWDFQNCR